MKTNYNRRNFLKTTAAFGLGLSLAPSFAFGENFRDSDKPVAIGFIGVGLRGRSHLDLLANMKDVRVPAICDVNPDANKKANAILRKRGKQEAAVYSEHEYSYQKLLKRKDLDGVIIATPWRWHSPMAVDAMEAGKYVGLEVPAATSLEGCWDLVHAHEETGTHLMFMENVCYAREVLAVLRMLNDNLFGEPVHATCGYKHDLRGVKFDGVNFGEDASNEAKWRTQHSLKRNADLYPTHGVGPVAKWFNINRGNRFNYLTSMATKSAGLHDYIVTTPRVAPTTPMPNSIGNWATLSLPTSKPPTEKPLSSAMIPTYPDPIPGVSPCTELKESGTVGLKGAGSTLRAVPKAIGGRQAMIMRLT